MTLHSIQDEAAWRAPAPHPLARDGVPMAGAPAGRRTLLLPPPGGPALWAAS